jgi:hypothetical protein
MRVARDENFDFLPPEDFSTGRSKPPPERPDFFVDFARDERNQIFHYSSGGMLFVQHG